MAAGGSLAFSFPEADVSPLAWISLAPLLIVAAAQRPATGAALGFAFGFAFFGILLYWISIVGWIAWFLLVVIQSTFLAGFGAAWAVVSRRGGTVGRILLAPLLWVAVEFIRAYAPLGGFTWGQLAQSQHDLGWMLRPAAFGGGWLTAFFIVAANAAIAETVLRWRAGHRRRAPVLAAVAAGAIAWPFALPAQTAEGQSLSVALVQGNVPRGTPSSVYDKERAIIESHERLTEQLVRPVDLVVWPESSVGLDPTLDAAAGEAVSDAARAAQAPLIFGGNTHVDDRRYKVMAFHVSPQGDIVDTYQKTHLVPFGERVPARQLLDWAPMLEQVPRDAVAGTEPVVFDVGDRKIAPVISFEGDFGPLVRRRMDMGARLLVVATNTSTWGESWASAQHVAFSQVRAAENGVWVVHAALSGISAFIQPDGSVAATTPMWVATSLVHDVRMAEDTTFYAATGEWFPIVALSVSAIALGLAAVARRRRVSAV